MLMLHISDIHFKHGEVVELDDPNRGLRNDMIHDVKYMRDRLGPLGMILLSGDIAYAGRKDEYDFAYSWLEKELCPAARCPIENVFVMVYFARPSKGGSSIFGRVGLYRPSADGLVRLDVDLASAGLYEGGQPQADVSRGSEAHFGNRNWLTF